MTARAAIATAALALAVLAAAGCVQRRIFVTSEPPGAEVWLNDVDVGLTPVEVDFTYFGVYDVRLRKDGFEPISTSAKAKAPPHEWPGLSFLALLVPTTKKTEIRWHYDLEPADNDPDALLARARELRASETARAEALAAEQAAREAAESEADPDAAGADDQAPPIAEDPPSGP